MNKRRVFRSAKGFFVGEQDCFGQLSRKITGYFPTYDKAKATLESMKRAYRLPKMKRVNGGRNPNARQAVETR
jgi:hypothetical protein